MASLADLPDPCLPTYEWLMPLAPWECPVGLAAVLSSLAAQTWPAQSMVVSVDGPLPDRLLQVLLDSGLPLRILAAPNWQGKGAVLARGLRACRSRWVLRTDADDISDSRRAELQLRYIMRHPHLAVLGTQLMERGLDGRSVGMRTVPPDSAAIGRWLRWRNPFNHSTVAINRDAVMAVGNYRSCPAFEDWDLWLRLDAVASLGANLDHQLVTAVVRGGHKARRHGVAHLHQKSSFLVHCARDGLLPWPQALLLLLLRLPWWLLPSGVQAALEACLRSVRCDSSR